MGIKLSNIGIQSTFSFVYYTPSLITETIITLSTRYLCTSIRKLMELIVNYTLYSSQIKIASIPFSPLSMGTEFEILIRTSVLNKDVFQHFLLILLETLQVQNYFFLIFKNSKIPFLETFGDKYNPQTQKYMSGLPKAAESEQKLSK